MYIEGTIFATVFVNQKENTDKSIFLNVSVPILIGEVDGQKQYEYDIWYGAFVGSCYEKAKHLESGTKITLLKLKIRNKYNKEKDKNYPSLTVFDFEIRE